MVNKITTPPTTSELIGKVNEIIDDKQDTLVSGTNIKTINNTSILGSGNIDIQSGSSYTAGTGIDITNDVISVDNSIVTTNTAQDITARKTFFGEKAIYFKQNTSSDKLGFTLYNNNNAEVGALEFRPSTISGAPILTLNSSAPNSKSYVGFRYWSYSLNIIAPFSTSLRSKNLFIPVTFTNGTTTVESTSTDGSVNISSLLPTKTSDLTNDSGYITSSALNGYATETYVDTGLASKQATLVSGTNIKTINNQSILGSGDLAISSRNIGEIVSSTIPLSDAGLHLLDGALISGSGSYADFVTYIAGLVSTYPDLFETESNWQQSVTDYGVCGKFVYDSVNNTVRLPKYNSKIYTGGGNAPVVGNGMTLGLTDGTKNFGLLSDNTDNLVARQSHYGKDVGDVVTRNGVPTVNAAVGVTTDSEKSGLIAQLSNITTSLDGYYYIVIATSTKTEIEVDIDEIATDLNGKADIDLNNINPTQTVKNTIVGWGMPDYNSKVTIATTTYEAPCDGYVWYRNNNIQAMTVTVGGIEWYTGTIAGTSGTAIFPISKGEFSVASTVSGVVAYFIPLKGVS